MGPIQGENSNDLAGLFSNEFRRNVWWQIHSNSFPLQNFYNIQNFIIHFWLKLFSTCFFANELEALRDIHPESGILLHNQVSCMLLQKLTSMNEQGFKKYPVSNNTDTKQKKDNWKFTPIFKQINVPLFVYMYFAMLF